MKIVPFVYLYKKHIDSYKKTVCDVLMKEIPFIFLNFQEYERKERYNYFISNRFYWIDIQRYV